MKQQTTTNELRAPVLGNAHIGYRDVNIIAANHPSLNLEQWCNSTTQEQHFMFTVTQ